MKQRLIKLIRLRLRRELERNTMKLNDDEKKARMATIDNKYRKPSAWRSKGEVDYTIPRLWRKSAGIELFYLNQSTQFETWECRCIKYLLGVFCHPNGSTRFESELVGIQCSLQIPNDLIQKKKIKKYVLLTIILAILMVVLPNKKQNPQIILYFN